jgi:hypothetical protein
MMEDLKLFYFVQPKEYLGTNIYKVGITNKNNIPLKRLCDYRKGTIVFLVLAMENVDCFEMKILLELNKICKIHKGKEYFEGDYELILEKILKTYEGHYEYYQRKKLNIPLLPTKN